MKIPIIDVGDLMRNEGQTNSESWNRISSLLVDALSTVGFAYIKGHGIPQNVIDYVNQTTGKFFSLPTEVKKKYQVTQFHGWLPFGTESSNPKRPGDLKEAFSANLTTMKDMMWPDSDVPEFSTTVKDFFKTCSDLAFVMMKLIAIGLQLEDHDFFTKQYHPLTKPNCTTLRVLKYPKLSDKQDLSADQVRCGEHTDADLCTLLFQDSVGGLEICGPDGEWIPATPIEGTVVFNLGEMTERWTSDKLKATPHRVFTKPGSSDVARRSLVFFVHPDDDVMVECLDGSNKYEKMTAIDFLTWRYAQVYQNK